MRLYDSVTSGNPTPHPGDDNVEAWEKWLIVNADDFGRTHMISEGICEAHLKGIVTSTSVMINLPEVLLDVESSQSRCPHLGFGVHLNLTFGPPISDPNQIPTLLTTDNTFPPVQHVIQTIDSLEPIEVEREWRAQIELFLTTGVRLDHLDSHHHIAALHPEFWGVLLALAHEYSLAVRHPCPATGAPAGILEQIPVEIRDYPCGAAVDRLRGSDIRSPDTFLSIFFGENAKIQNLIDLLSNLPPGVHELMTHPGYVDQHLIQQSSYSHQREEEIKILCDPVIVDEIQTNSISLHRFSEIPAR